MDPEDQPGGTGETDNLGGTEADAEREQRERQEFNNKMRRRNRELEQRLKERDEEMEDLRAQLEDRQNGKASAEADRGADGRKSHREAERRKAREAELVAQNEKLARQLFMRDLQDEVLRDVPTSNRDLAKDVLTGLMASGAVEIDYDDPDPRAVAKQAAKAMRARHSRIFRDDASPPPPAAGTGDRSKVFERVNHPSQVAMEDWKNVPAQELGRILLGRGKPGDLGV